MQVKFKDLKKNIHTVECEPTDTIVQLKESLANILKLDTATNDIKLIFSGTILKNDQSVSDSKLVNESVVSFLVKKVKAKTPTPQPSKSVEPVKVVDPVSEPAIESQPNNTTSAPAPATSTATAPTSTTNTTTTNNNNNAAASTSSETEDAAYRQSASVLMELGYSEQQVMAALRMSNGDADRACEILMSGLLSEEQAATENQQNASTTNAASSAADGGNDDDDDENDEDLFAAAANAVGGSGSSRGASRAGAASDNQITLTMDDLVSLRQIANGDTTQLPAFLENMSQRLPQFNELIQSNPEMFLSMLLDSLQGNLGNLGNIGGAFTAASGGNSGNSASASGSSAGGAGSAAMSSIPPEMMNESFLKFASVLQQSGIDPENMMSQMMDPSFDPSTIPGFEDFAREAISNPEYLQQMAKLLLTLMLTSSSAAAAASRPPPISPLQQLEAQLSESEKEAINRLCELGFDRVLVIQIYLACDKNEEIAANMLFTEYAD
ncbi:hypothetical protein ACO0SA_002792 [Hanseniaspora valbyensis]